jgi:carboxypeptidase C (cathepsin A)
MDVNTAWKVDTNEHAFERQVGATDDLRYALSLNPHMNLFITHGLYDLVTPYFSSNRLVEQMKLLPEQRQRITLQHFHGGHMFYAWEASRRAFFAAMDAFYAASV